MPRRDVGVVGISVPDVRKKRRPGAAHSQAMAAIPRIHIAEPLRPGHALALPANAARHIQVLRLQPGAPLILFDGTGGEWTGTVLQIGRREVTAQVGEHRAVERELARPVVLAVGMPANERMDGLIEKATELGVAAIQPLVCERSVLRLSGERAERKAAHWQSVAAAACEQSGRNRLPAVAPPRPLRHWLEALPTEDDGPPAARWVLSLAAQAQPWAHRPVPAADAAIILLSGPEGGLTEAEQVQAQQFRFAAISLGARTLRADTAPLAALAALALHESH